MLNFKQYLQESEVRYELFILINCIESFSDEELSAIRDAFQNTQNTTYRVADFEISFYTKLGRDKVHNYDYIDQIKTDIVLTLKQVLEKTNNAVNYTNDVVLNCYGIPDTLVDYQIVNIKLASTNTNLTNIEKVVGKSVEILYIEHCQYLKERVLSLFKLTRVDELYLTNTVFDPEYHSSNLTPWQKIVQTHFNTGRNIAACQTELMKNGFKEYAKL